MANDQNKYAGISTLRTFLSQLKNLFITKTDADAALSGKADKTHNHNDLYYTEEEVDSKLANKADSSHSHSNYVPTSRTVNGKTLASNISLSASDVGALPDTTSIPDSLSDLSSDSTHRTVTDAEKATWNAKSNFSGSYNDLTNKPTIPSISGLATEAYVNDVASNKVDKISGKGLSTNDYTTTEKNKLSGISSGAEVNQNAFSNVVVGSTTIAADSKTDSLTIAAGTGISVTGDATNDKVTITNSGVCSIATGSANGTISVNTNGASANVAVKGLGSAAYTASTAYDAAGTAQTKADAALASAKSYTNEKISALLDGADDTTLDSIKELADAIKNNDSAIDALNDIASGKADAEHGHAIADISGLQSALDGKAASSHGTHVSYSTTAPVMDGTASAGSASTVARSDHKHPTDTSRAAKTDLDNHTADTTKHITSTERSNWNAAKTNAATAQTRADEAYALAESKVDSLSDLGITATAAELNHMDGVTSNVQTQLDELRNDVDAIPQSDWNQNDSTKLDFVKNRPFYTTDPVETVIAEGTIPAGGMLKTSASINLLTIGETYNAVFDGATYNNLVCVNYDGLPSIGNDVFMFAIQSGRAMAYASNGSVSHTLKVMANLVAVVPLERKYIAEHIDVLAGEKVAGKVYTVDNESVTAGKGAEVFNDYSTNIASGQYSHAEGVNNIASGSASHAEGYGAKATGSYSHAEGYETTASASRSHAEGWTTEATAQAAHAEGFATHATGQYSHAEGDNATASGRASHAEGYATDAVADYSHAEGLHTNASSEYQHVQGKYNVIDANDTYAHIVGNGSSNSSRKNAHTIDWQGNANFAGDVYVGNANENKAGKKLATEEYVDALTYSDVGAAPSGFGLGTGVIGLGETSVDTLDKTGFYYGCIGIPNGWGNSFIVNLSSGNWRKQLAFTLKDTTGLANKSAEREMNGGVWGDWVETSPDIFAPSGYGWGEKHAPDAPGLDPDYVDTTCVFIANAGGSPADGVWLGSFLAQAGGANGSMVMEALNGSCVGCRVIRQKLNGVWQPWEWVNPPMQVGVEYRTTERYNGKPVYITLTGSVQLPVNSLRSISYCNDTNIKATPIDIQLQYSASYAAEYSELAGIPTFIEKVWADANEYGYTNCVYFKSNSYTGTAYDYAESATVRAIVKYIKEDVV